MRWRESIDKVERAAQRSEPRSRRAKEPVRETKAIQGSSTVAGARCRRRGPVQCGPVLQGRQLEGAKKTGGLWGLLRELFQWWGV